MILLSRSQFDADIEVAIDTTFGASETPRVRKGVSLCLHGNSIRTLNRPLKIHANCWASTNSSEVLPPVW